MAYKVLSSLTANNVNSADLLKVKTDLLIIAINKKTAAAAELIGLQASAQSLVKESIKEINSADLENLFSSLLQLRLQQKIFCSSKSQILKQLAF